MNNTILSSRNFQNTKVITAEMLNTYDILNSGKLIISEKALVQIDKQFKVIRNGKYYYQTNFN